MVTKRYLEVREFDREQFALALVENRKAALKERVGEYRSFSVNIDGKPDFPFSSVTETDKRELRALDMAQKMAREGYTSFAWISGPGGDKDAPYKDTRITVINVANVTDSRVYFDGNVAICSEIGASRCVELANNLTDIGGKMWGQPQNVEELREVVVGFEDSRVIERLADVLVEMEEVWRGIEQGQGGKNFKEMTEVAKWVETRFAKEMRGVKSEWDSIQIGAMVEMGIRQQFGVHLMAGGAHGMSNTAAMLQLGGGAFNTIFSMAGVSNEQLSPHLEKCGGCGNYYIKKKKKCPKCSG